MVRCERLIQQYPTTCRHHDSRSYRSGREYSHRLDSAAHTKRAQHPRTERYINRRIKNSHRSHSCCQDHMHGQRHPRPNGMRTNGWRGHSFVCRPLLPRIPSSRLTTRLVSLRVLRRATQTTSKHNVCCYQFAYYDTSGKRTDAVVARGDQCVSSRYKYITEDHSK